MPASKPSFDAAGYAFGAGGIRMHARPWSPENTAARAVGEKCRLPDDEAYRERRGHR
ncbi:MAG TPA: hypothetical protein VGB36_16130 [Gammaproteobacteria bacterium]